MSRNATVGLVLGRIGSGAPCAVTPCHTRIATTQSAVAKMPMRKAGFIYVGVYHIRNAVAAGGLRFFSDALRAYIFRPRGFVLRCQAKKCSLLKYEYSHILVRW